MTASNTTIFKGVTVQQEADKSKTIIIQPGSGSTTNTAMTVTAAQTANRTLTLPDATDTLVGKATTDVLTNKTLTGNTAVSLTSGSGTLVLNTSGTATVPNATDTLVGRATTDTLTNKTLTGNTAVNLISGSGTFVLNTTGTITAPNATDTLVGKATTDTLTNKTLTTPVINSPTGLVKADVGLGNVDNTSDATKNSDVATLTNKTLTSPTINTPTISGGSITSLTSLAVDNLLLDGNTISSTNTNGDIILDPNGTGAIQITAETSGNIKLKAAAATTAHTLTMPDAQGASSTFLQNDGSGNLSWVAGGVTGASTSLNNLTITSINQDLLPSSDAGRVLGSSTLAWSDLYARFVRLDNASSASTIILAGTGTGLGTPTNAPQLLGTTATGEALALTTSNEATANSTATAGISIYTGNKTAGTGDSGSINFQTGTSAGGLRGQVTINASKLQMSASLISGVLDPVSAQDAATKAYVDARTVVPTIQKFLVTGTTTGYRFTVTAANATAGDTYTNNGNTYTVLATIVGATTLFTSQSAAPQASGTLTRTSGSGDATIAFSASVALGTYTTPTSPRTPSYIRVRMVGGGGGGAGSSTTAASNGGNGGTGGTTSFGSNLLSCSGGIKADGGGTVTGAAGGTASIGSAIGTVFSGSRGGGAAQTATANTFMAGGQGGVTPFGGGSGGGGITESGGAVIANTGCGGTGGGSPSAGISGAGGGAGGYIDAIISTPSATYPYVVAAGGTAGAAGTSGAAGAAGATGYIEVTEYY